MLNVALHTYRTAHVAHECVLQLVLRVLQGHRCKFEERDVMLSRVFAQEFKERCSGGEELPQLFHNGKQLGVGEVWAGG